MTAARDIPEDLLGEFEAWANDHGVDVDPFVIDTALDLLDGAPWTADSVHDLLVERFPRKVTLSAAERPAVLATLHRWIDFLAGRHITGFDDPAALHAEVDRAATAFLTAMADERNYGVAKFWATRMSENGVDTDDKTQVARFLTMVQRGDIDYDDEVLAEIARRGSFDAEIGVFDFEDERDHRLPPVSLATTEELTTLAEAAPLTIRLRTFVTWLGTGRTLTTTKRLRVADAKDLAGRLDVDHPYLARARSSADLPELSLMVEWARKAGLVRVLKGRLVGVKSAAGVLDHPLELWQRAFAAFPELGPAVCGPISPYEPPSLLGQLLPEVAPALWLSLYTSGDEPAPMEMLVEITRDAMIEPVTMSVGNLIVNIGEIQWRRDLTAVLVAMRTLGAVELTTSTDPAERDRLVALSGNDDPDLTLVRLTPLGRWAARDALRAEGFDVPLVEDMAGQPVDFLCDALEQATPEVTDAVLTAWVAARGEAAAAAELAEFCVAAPSPSARLVAMNGLARTGTAGIEQAHRLRATGGVAGAVATTWLIQHSVLDQDDADEQELLLSLADNFAAMHEHDVLIDELVDFPVDDQLGFVRALAGTDHPARAALLDVIATEHPDRAVATAARKANNGQALRNPPAG